MKTIVTYIALIVAGISTLLWAPAAQADSAAKQAFELLNKKEYARAYEVSKKSREPHITDLLSWYYMRRVPDDWTAANLTSFANEHADWPKIDDLTSAAKYKGLDKALAKFTPAELAFKRWRRTKGKVRNAIEARQYTSALSMLKNHGMKSGAGFADAEWLTGWLLLEKKNSPSKAYKHFENLYENVNYAISRARAAYWAGRAAEALGKQDLAANWYEKAAGFPVTFYGQLAYTKIYPGNKLVLPDVNHPSSSEASQFAANNSLLGVAKLCFKYGQLTTLNLFVKQAVLYAPSEEDMHLAAAYLSKAQGASSGIKAAKRALQRNLYLGDISFPEMKLSRSNVEPALVHSIIRQESEFDPKIRSSAGATGLMQLMPGTAKLVAKRLGISHQPHRITEPKYNVTLGTAYLGQMLDRYDGSYILAIASYNAGPGNVDKWVKRFGRPGKDLHGAINWMEKIPFSETRNYVQRVMENLQVYREKFTAQPASGLLIDQDLTR